MSISRFEEWKEHFSERPFGTKRDNIHAAMIAATLRNLFSGKSAKKVGIEDFLLQDVEEAMQSNLSSGIGALLAVATPKEKLKQKAKERKRKQKRKRNGRPGKTRSKA